MQDKSRVNTGTNRPAGRRAASRTPSSLVIDGPVQPLIDAALAARAQGEIAILALASIANDPNAPATARVAAASKLLERGFGRTGVDLGGVARAETDLLGLTDDEFDALLRQSGET